MHARVPGRRSRSPSLPLWLLSKMPASATIQRRCCMTSTSRSMPGARRPGRTERLRQDNAVQDDSGSFGAVGRCPLSRGCPLANFGYVPQSATLDPQFPLSASEIVEMGAYGRVHPFKFLPGGEKEQSQSKLCSRLVLQQIAAKSFLPFPAGKNNGADCPCIDGEPEDHGFRRAAIRRR